MTAPDRAIILAVASAPGRSARGVVRLSGAGALEALAAIAVDAAPIRERGARVARLRVGAVEVPAVVLVAPGPRSYTGEDAAEVILPGNPRLLDRVIDAIIEAAGAEGLDARRAEPGEFTARAWFEGRIDLAGAEGVAATIAARSDAELRAAHWLRDGRPAACGRRVADAIVPALALVEAGIDFTDEEDVVAIERDDLLARLDGVLAHLERERTRAVPLEALEAMPRVVLTGPPNAGKSTLFNRLLGRGRAVVSDVAGTTRDVLAEPLTIPTPSGPAEVMLVDVAGEDDDAVDDLGRSMRARAADAAARAALRIACAPPGAPVPEEDERTLVVRTQGDRAGDDAEGLRVSAVTGAGIDDLVRAVADRLADAAVSLAADAVVLAPRHATALARSEARVREARDVVAAAPAGAPFAAPEIIAACLRAALDDLAIVVGTIAPDDVLDYLFASFCIGK